MTATLTNAPQKRKRTASQHFKGTIDGADFTANVFEIKRNDGRWTITGSKTYSDGVKHRLSLTFPDTYVVGLYKLQDHPDIRLTYSTDSLTDPILRYGAHGIIDLLTVDPSNTHVSGALADIVTRDDGNPISTISALFSLG
jgi:hypothetical protein